MIDFGLAVFAESSVSLTAPHTVVGTPSCMAPEQANGEKPLTPAVDVYALGAVLLFAASGHPPYRADNIHLLFHHVVDPAFAPDLSGAPDELAPLLTAMLAHRAQDRPDLAEVVRRCRALIEAQGLKVAQARRRLTTYTAAPTHVLDDLLAVGRASGPGVRTAPGTAGALPTAVAARARRRRAGTGGGGPPVNPTRAERRRGRPRSAIGPRPGGAPVCHRSPPPPTPTHQRCPLRRSHPPTPVFCSAVLTHLRSRSQTTVPPPRRPPGSRPRPRPPPPVRARTRPPRNPPLRCPRATRQSAAARTGLPCGVRRRPASPLGGCARRMQPVHPSDPYAPHTRDNGRALTRAPPKHATHDRIASGGHG
ncbi:protein kinase domain-containing protein [Streptomyces lasalocidi]